MCVHVWIHMYICLCACMHVCVCTDAYVYTCSSVCVLLYRYVHMSVHVNANLIHIPILYSCHAFIYKPLSQHPEYQETKLLAFSSSFPSWASILWQLSLLRAPPSQVLSPPKAGKPRSLFSLFLDATLEHFPPKASPSPQLRISADVTTASLCGHLTYSWEIVPRGHRFLELYFSHLVV